MYDDVRQAVSPREALLDFLQSTYEAGASLAKWDRPALEKATSPRRREPLTVEKKCRNETDLPTRNTLPDMALALFDYPDSERSWLLL